MRFSNGVVKIGFSNRPEARRRAIEKQPNMQGLSVHLSWVSGWIEGAAYPESYAKAFLGSGARPSNATEEFHLPLQTVIAAAKCGLALHVVLGLDE